MSNQIELRLSGSGGQGLLLAGIIISEAAITEGKNAVQTQSYGPEARGGASKAEVIISDSDIDFPKVTEPDMMLALTQVACDKYAKTLTKKGTLIIDSRIKVPAGIKAKKIISVPILDTATEKVGKSIVGNIVALGVIQSVTNVVSKEALEKAVMNRIPRGTEELNRYALEEGYKLV